MGIQWGYKPIGQITNSCNPPTLAETEGALPFISFIEVTSSGGNQFFNAVSKSNAGHCNCGTFSTRSYRSCFATLDLCRKPRFIASCCVGAFAVHGHGFKML